MQEIGKPNTTIGYKTSQTMPHQGHIRTNYTNTIRKRSSTILLGTMGWPRVYTVLQVHKMHEYTSNYYLARKDECTNLDFGKPIHLLFPQAEMKKRVIACIYIIYLSHISNTQLLIFNWIQINVHIYKNMSSLN